MIGLGGLASMTIGLFLALFPGLLRAVFRGASGRRTAFDLKTLATIPLVESPAPKAAGRAPQMKQNSKVARFLPEGSHTQRHTQHHVAGMVLHDPKARFCESIRSLRQALRQAGLGRGIKVLQLTSALPGEGKSSIAVNLARACALCGDSVLLIDADLRRPALAANIGLSGSPGLAAALGGRAELSHVVVRDGQSDLHCIAGDAPVSGTEALTLLSSPRLRRLIDAARRAYSIVIIDSGALLPVADARVLVGQVDAVVLVVAPEMTEPGAVQAAREETPGIESKLLGAVMNHPVNDFGRDYAEYGSLYKVA